MTFEDVYAQPHSPSILYDLLNERTGDATVNISHRAFPPWAEHVEFIESRPYAYWYLLRVGTACVGAVYLTKADEIGVHIFRKYHGNGYGGEAVEMLIKRHPRRAYKANINPANERSIALFQKLGFRLLQQTYAWEGTSA